MEEFKFATTQDRQKTEELAESAKLEFGSFLKKRKRILGRTDKLHKDFRKKQDAKRSWKNKRRTYMKGINRFHSSTKGKTFHRKLNRFLQNRAPLYKEWFSPEAQTAILSLQTHLVIESAYMIPDFDTHLSFWTMFNHAMPILNNIVPKLMEEQELNEEEILILTDLCTGDINV